MNLLSNADISRKYNVSKSTVTLWVQSAISKKNNLQLSSDAKKVRVIDNEHNNIELLRLKSEGQRYKSKDDFLKVEISDEFYSIFNTSEIVDIANNLELGKEIQHKYSYKNGGSEFWSNYYYETQKDSSYPTTSKVITLLNEMEPYIKRRIKDSDKINIIDIGQGNSEPVRSFLSTLVKTNKINKYVAVDISPEMIEISRNNIKKWFPDLEFQGFVCDIERSYLGKELSEYLGYSDSLNLFLLIGGTIGNLSHRNDALHNIKDALNRGDLFIYSNTVDRPNIRTSFSYATSKVARDQNTWIPKLLGIDIDNCDIEARFDPDLSAKKIILKLDKDYQINFRIFNHNKSINLFKGDEIMIWRHHMTDLNTFQNDLRDASLQLTSMVTETNLTHVMISCEANSL